MHLQLSNNARMPLVGLGTWKLGPAIAADAVYNALKAGYRLIDAACDYGNEKEVGAGLARAIKEGVVTRDQVFITSKLWNTYHRKEHVKPALEKTLADLGVDYVDLYLIHFPIAQKFVPFNTRYPPEWFFDPNDQNPKVCLDKVSYQETYQAMEELVADGTAKAIGCCNVGTHTLRDVLSYCRIPPAVLQVELHPYNSQPKLVRFCQENDIAVTGFSNFGPLSYGASDVTSCFDLPAVRDSAKKHGKTPAQVLLRWAVQRKTAVIPKSSNEQRLAENLAIFDFELDPAEVALIDAVNENRRFNDPGVFCEEAFNTFLPIYE